ncbi:MAG TPA: hypothetical protein VE685_20840 [Thermoanaerobaculia bacterium]|nr:hypothetical protein [Thermoanaerobaculia bacterium]
MAGVKLKRPRVVVYPTPEQLARWESWANTWRRPLPRFVAFVMDYACHVLREQERGRRTDLDEIGLRLDQRDKLRAIVIQARDALDKLAESLR